MPEAKRKHGRGAGSVVIEERQRGDHGHRGELYGLPAPPIAFVAVEHGHHAQDRDAVIAGMAEIHEQLRRPSAEQEDEQPQARVLREVLAQNEPEEPQRKQSGKRVEDPGAGFADAEEGEPRGGEEVLQRRPDVAEVLVQMHSVGTGDEVAAVPTHDVSRFQQVPGGRGDQHLVGPESHVVQVHQADVRGDEEDAQRQRRARIGPRPFPQFSHAAQGSPPPVTARRRTPPGWRRRSTNSSGRAWRTPPGRRPRPRDWRAASCAPASRPARGR